MPKPPPESPPAPLVHSTIETARLLGISRSNVYRLIAAGRIRTVHIGARHMVPAEEVRRIAREGVRHA